VTGKIRKSERGKKGGRRRRKGKQERFQKGVKKRKAYY
jgi:hypothetical protein